VSEDKPVVLFGAGPVAMYVHYVLTHDSPHRVVATSVDRAHLDEPSSLDLPVVAFEELPDRYPPDAYRMFIAVGYRRVNRLRAERYQQAKAMGYELITHVSPRASVWPDLRIGDNCLVMDNVMIHPFVTIGNDVILWSGAHIGNGSTVGDHCWIASCAVVSGYVTVGPSCFLGSNCTIRHAITIGRETVVGAGAVIVKDTLERGVYAAPEPRRLPGTSDRLPGL
jgi:sugar O-acyltransferase (sialic acid O-acetyltransferase NeuD family)